MRIGRCIICSWDIREGDATLPGRLGRASGGSYPCAGPWRLSRYLLGKKSGKTLEVKVPRSNSPAAWGREEIGLEMRA